MKVRSRLYAVSRSRGLAQMVKPALAGLQIFAEGPTGIGDPASTFQEDMAPHATLEISTLGWPMGTEPLVDLLRSRWIAERGHPPAEETR